MTDDITCPVCGGDGIGGEYVPELCGEGEDRTCEHCDGAGVIEHVPFYSVAIYMVDRAYGGPEEGGWWFDTGEPIDYIPEGMAVADLVALFPPDKKAEAFAHRDALNAKLDAGPNVGRREISSVLSEGRYAAMLSVGLPKAYPATQPHYE